MLHLNKITVYHVTANAIFVCDSLYYHAHFDWFLRKCWERYDEVAIVAILFLSIDILYIDFILIQITLIFPFHKFPCIVDE